MEQGFVGIDVAKDRLDVHVRPSGDTFALARDGEGVAALVERLRAAIPQLIVLEATGGFEQVVAAQLAALWRAAAKGPRSGCVFVNERGHPFGRMGIGRMIERAGEAAGLPFPVHVHMLRHSTGYALAARGMDTRRLQHYLGHTSITNTVRYTAMSPEPFKDIWR